MDQHPEEWKLLCARAAVEQDATALLKLITRINDLLDRKQARLEGKRPERRAEIFQIAYDELLLVARSQVLESYGYDVDSALGNEDARRILTKGGAYRLFLLGHAAPAGHRDEMLKWLKRHFPDATVISINSPGEPALPDADFNFVVNGPEKWMAVVSTQVAASGRTDATPSN